MTNDKTGVFTTNAHEAFSLLGECYIIRSCLDNYYHSPMKGGKIEKIYPIDDNCWEVDNSDWSISKEEMNGIWQCISSSGHVFGYKPDTLEKRREKFRKRIETEDRWISEKINKLIQKLPNKKPNSQ